MSSQTKTPKIQLDATLVDTSTTQTLTGKTVNGVVLDATGAATSYLDKTGNYSTPASGGSATTNALNSAGTTVNVSAAAIPTTGQVLTATSGTAATWQTPSGGGSYWDNTYQVSGSDFTTSSTTLVNITGLVTGTLAASAVFEFEAVLLVVNAFYNKLKFGVNCTGTSSTAQALYIAQTSNGAAAVDTTVDLATVTTLGFNSTSPDNIPTVMIIKGTFQTGTGSPAFSIMLAKPSMNAPYIKIGSILKIKRLV